MINYKGNIEKYGGKKKKKGENIDSVDTNVTNMNILRENIEYFLILVYIFLFQTLGQAPFMFDLLIFFLFKNEEGDKYFVFLTAE